MPLKEGKRCSKMWRFSLSLGMEVFGKAKEVVWKKVKNRNSFIKIQKESILGFYFLYAIIFYRSFWIIQFLKNK